MPHEIKKSHILVTASVPEEAKGIKQHLSSLGEKRIGKRLVYFGTLEGVAVHLIETGPGMVNTAQSLTAVIEANRPSLILMTGCGGGFSKAGMNVGDIGVATEENDTHLGIESELEDGILQPLPFDLAVVDGVAIRNRIYLEHRLSTRAMDILKNGFKESPLSVVQGPFVTVSTITATERGGGRLYDRFHPCIENMEGAAGAYVAKHYGIPFLEIRCASNLVGKRHRASWDVPLACRRSGEAVMMWIRATKGEL